MIASITGRRQKVGVVKNLKAVVDFFKSGNEFRLEGRDDGHASEPSVYRVLVQGRHRRLTSDCGRSSTESRVRVASLTFGFPQAQGAYAQSRRRQHGKRPAGIGGHAC